MIGGVGGGGFKIVGTRDVWEDPVFLPFRSFSFIFLLRLAS